MIRWPASLGAALYLTAACAYAHGGGLDKHGCHTERRTGQYHCHRAVAPERTAVDSTGPADNRQRLVPDSARSAYRNCDDARAHGAAPVRRGDPGYGPHLDRDQDGVGCEPYRSR